MKTIYAAVLALALSASAAAAQQASLQCGGTEPFWSITVTRTAMWISTPDEDRVNLVLVQPRNATARQPDLVRVYQTRRADGKGPATLVVTRNESSCSDGMSEKRYAYDAVYFDRERVLQGCCSWGR